MRILFHGSDGWENLDVVHQTLLSFNKASTVVLCTANNEIGKYIINVAMKNNYKVNIFMKHWNAINRENIKIRNIITKGNPNLIVLFYNDVRYDNYVMDIIIDAHNRNIDVKIINDKGEINGTQYENIV